MRPGNPPHALPRFDEPGTLPRASRSPGWYLAPPVWDGDRGLAPAIYSRDQETVLAVQLVDGLTRRLRYFAGCVLDGSGQLISCSFVCQLIVPGCSAEAFFEPPGETSSAAGKALFRSPQSGSVSSILYIIVSGRILRTRLVEHNVRRESDTYTRDYPSKTFHSRISLAIGCAYREGRRSPSSLRRESGQMGHPAFVAGVAKTRVGFPLQWLV